MWIFARLIHPNCMHTFLRVLFNKIRCITPSQRTSAGSSCETRISTSAYANEAEQDWFFSPTRLGFFVLAIIIIPQPKGVKRRPRGEHTQKPRNIMAPNTQTQRWRSQRNRSTRPGSLLKYLCVHSHMRELIDYDPIAAFGLMVCDWKLQWGGSLVQWYERGNAWNIDEQPQ